MDQPPQNYRAPATRPATAVAFCFYCGRPGVAGATCSTCAVPVSDPERQAPVASGCPRCGSGLDPLAVDAEASIHSCGACGGVFVGARAWSSFLLSPDLLDTVEGRLPSPPSLPAFTPLLRCVTCSREMERSRFAVTSEVQIDVCAEHGIWLDGGELGEAVRFAVRRAEMGADPALRGWWAQADAVRPQLNPSDAAYVAELERAGRDSIDRAVDRIHWERSGGRGYYMPPELLPSRHAYGARWTGASTRGRFPHWAFWPPFFGVVLFFSLLSTDCGRRILVKERAAHPPAAATPASEAPERPRR